MNTQHKNLKLLKPKITKDIAVYEWQGLEIELLDLINLAHSHLSALQSMRLKGLFFSCKNISITNAKDLNKCLDLANSIGKKLRISCGFCDYSSLDFSLLKELSLGSGLILAKNFQTASLLLGVNQVLDDDIVLIYDEYKEMGAQIYSKLAKQNILATMAQDELDFKQRASLNPSYIIYETRLNQKDSHTETSFKKGCFIYMLEGFLNADVALDFNFAKHKQRIKNGFRAFFFDVSKAYAIDEEARAFLCEMSKSLGKYATSLYIYGINEQKISYQVPIDLEKNHVIIKKTFDECYSDAKKRLLVSTTKDLGDKQALAVSKKLIQNIPIFVQSSVGVFKAYGYEKLLSKPSKPKINCLSNIKKCGFGMISLDGDINATVFLCFSQDQINTMFENVFFEPPADETEQKDFIKEILNMLGGNIKLALDGKESISISLPRAFISCDEFAQEFGQRHGISTELFFMNEPIEMFFIGSVLLDIL